MNLWVKTKGETFQINSYNFIINNKGEKEFWVVRTRGGSIKLVTGDMAEVYKDMFDAALVHNDHYLEVE